MGNVLYEFWANALDRDYYRIIGKYMRKQYPRAEAEKLAYEYVSEQIVRPSLN